MDLNRSTLLGRLTQDLELKVTPAGKEVLSTSLVTNNVYTDQQGNRQETADFHNIVLWGNLAKNLSNYARKGSRIYVEGALKTRSWEKQDWSKAYRTEILVNNFILLDSKKDNQTAQPQQQASASNNYNAAEEEISVEDLPF